MKLYAVTFAVALILGLSLTVAPAAVASPPATGAEARAILRVAPGNPYPPGWAHLTVRVSTVGSRWAGGRDEHQGRVGALTQSAV
jgi:hypothetical protein